MNIQSNINQGLSVASMLISMNPAVRAKAEQRREIRGLEKQKETITQARDITASNLNPDEAMKYHEQLGDINKRLFELDPSQESFEQYSKGISKSEPIYFEADPEEIALERYEKQKREEEIRGLVEQYEKADPDSAYNQKLREQTALAKQQEEERKAQEAMTAKQEERRKGRRKFSDYIADEPTSLGVPFGQLDPKVQQELLKSYSKAERKSIMDRKDAMNEQK